MYEQVRYTAQANDIVPLPAVLGAVVLGCMDPVLDSVVLGGVMLGRPVLGRPVLGFVVLGCVMLGGVVLGRPVLGCVMLGGVVLGCPVDAEEPVTRTSTSEVKVYIYVDDTVSIHLILPYKI